MSELTLEKIEPIEDAFARLRKAPLDAAGGQSILIYQNASMRICDFMPEELNPTSLYVLENHLDSLRHLREELLKRYQIDILRFSSILHVRTPDGVLIGIAPPFVEVYEETVQLIPREGDRVPPPRSVIKVPVLKDGIHRAWIAREENIPLCCVVVSGATGDYLPYAYPNSWSEVKLYAEKPEEKKFYRRQNPYTYLRPIKALRQVGDKPPDNEWGR